ncbi:MAG: hypothetical protein JW779_09990 [Candidatus Thorarchaeota archaeon]|nr:hypothetical protein [Candidatus Thorarchaeota archaeon]
MVIRLKDAIIDSVDDTETRRLRLLKISSKSDGAALTLELPEALCGALNTSDVVDIVVDSKPIPKSDASKLYIEGTVFKKSDKKGLEVIGSIGGLRFVINIAKATPSQISTFDTEKFYLTIK